MDFTLNKREFIMENHQITFRFSQLNERDANEAATMLKEFIEEESPVLKPKFHKENKTNMDFGATLILVLGAPAIVSLATGISTYLARRPDTELEVHCENGKTIKFKGRSEDAAKIAESLKGLCLEAL